MSELRTVINTMRPTKSTSTDKLSMKTVKKLQSTLEPALLQLVNLTITTQHIPRSTENK